MCDISGPDDHLIIRFSTDGQFSEIDKKNSKKVHLMLTSKSAFNANIDFFFHQRVSFSMKKISSTFVFVPKWWCQNGQCQIPPISEGRHGDSNSIGTVVDAVKHNDKYLQIQFGLARGCPAEGG